MTSTPHYFPLPPGDPATPVKPKQQPLLQDTPLVRNENAQQDAFDPKDAKPRNRRYATEAQKFFVGPMPPSQFIKDFLPPAQKPLPACSKVFMSVPSKADKEEDIYGPLIDALNRGNGKRGWCPGFTFANTSTRAEHAGVGSMKPDICCYANGSIGKLRDANNKIPANLGYAEFFIEVKRTAKHDFFHDPSHRRDRTEHRFILDPKANSQKHNEQAKEALGQNVAYATEACSRQHRLFYFSIALSGCHARLIRWDRAGAIVTSAFDIRQEPKPLCQFLWCFAHASNEDRGYDPTVTWAPREEKRFARAITARVKWERELEDGPALDKAVEEHYQRGFVTAVEVYGNGADGTVISEQLLVSRPVVALLSMASRATRGYWAVTPDDRVVFLKDTWRYHVDGLEQEGIVLERLQSARIRNIPSMRLHGDIPRQSSGPDSSDAVQCTWTDRYTSAPWSCTGGRHVVVIPHVHYRLVLNTVGYGLDRFESTKELLHTTYDAFESMVDANSHRILHRDISVGNVVLVREQKSGIRRGYLIDWEFSNEDKEDGSNEHRKYERTGTWAFMSAKILNDSRAKHTIADDMESMMYVVLYCAMRWLPHDVEPTKLARTLYRLFDYQDIGHDYTVGGEGKAANRDNRCFTKDFIFDSALDNWLASVMSFNRPLEDEPPELKDNWNPEKLLDFWRFFLSQNSLPSDDRKKRKILDSPRDLEDNPHAATQTSSALVVKNFHSAANMGSRGRPKRIVALLYDNPVQNSAKLAPPPAPLPQSGAQAPTRLGVSFAVASDSALLPSGVARAQAPLTDLRRGRLSLPSGSHVGSVDESATAVEAHAAPAGESSKGRAPGRPEPAERPLARARTSREAPSKVPSRRGGPMQVDNTDKASKPKAVRTTTSGNAARQAWK